MEVTKLVVGMRRSRHEWAKLVVAASRSGLSLSEFGRRHGITVRTRVVIHDIQSQEQPDEARSVWPERLSCPEPRTMGGLLDVENAFQT